MPTSGDRSQAQQHTPAVSVTAPVVGSSSAAQQQQQQQPQSWVPQTRQQQQQPQQQQIQQQSLLQQPVQPHQNQNQMWPGQPHVSSAGVATQPYYGANGVVSVPGYPAGQMGWTVNGMGYSLPYFPARVKKVKMKRNCEACTHAKVKCDGKRPCSRCKTRGVAKTCKFLPKKSRWDKSRGAWVRETKCAMDTGHTINLLSFLVGVCRYGTDDGRPALRNGGPHDEQIHDAANPRLWVRCCLILCVYSTSSPSRADQRAVPIQTIIDSAERSELCLRHEPVLRICLCSSFWRCHDPGSHAHREPSCPARRGP